MITENYILNTALKERAHPLAAIGFPNIDGARPANWKRGAVIMRESGAPAACFVIATGKVKLVKKDRNGKNFLLALLRPGDAFGLPAVLNGEPYSSTAIAIENASGFRIDAVHFHRWYQYHPSNFQQVMRLLCAELGRAEERVNSMMRVSASSRLAEVILIIESVYGTSSDGTLSVFLRPREYADLTNVARGTIYRLLRQFADEGLIEFSGTAIRVLNRTGLQDVAGI